MTQHRLLVVLPIMIFNQFWAFFLMNFGMNEVLIKKNQVLKKKKHLLTYSVNCKLFDQDLKS